MQVFHTQLCRLDNIVITAKFIRSNASVASSTRFRNVISLKLELTASYRDISRKLLIIPIIPSRPVSASGGLRADVHSTSKVFALPLDFSSAAALFKISTVHDL